MFDDVLDAEEKFDINNINREQKTLIYVLNTFNELVEKGLMEGGGYEVSETGLELIKGFEPTEEELQECIRQMKEQGILE